MRKGRFVAAALLTLLPIQAFAGGDDTTIPIIGIFGKLIVLGANLWGLLTWIIPVIILGSTIMTALYFLRREQIGMSITSAGIGIFLAILLGFAMYKAGPTIHTFAENIGSMSSSPIEGVLPDSE